MNKNKKESFFWTSYSDLMTSLFFVMLVLFVLVIVLLHNKMMDIEGERKATQNQLDKITEIQNATENINNQYFQYDKEFKRHTLNDINVSFRTGSSDIFDISDTDRGKLLKAGSAIFAFMSKAERELPEAKYMLILEGQSSKDNYIYNYELSYQRALSLYKYWLNHNIPIDKLKNCEVIISGSGQSSRFRVEPDVASNKNNQRFVIHIIPKPGVIEN
jgi:flagellar motor protein MotB